MSDVIENVSNVTRTLNRQLNEIMDGFTEALLPENIFNCIQEYEDMKAMIKDLVDNPTTDYLLEIEWKMLDFRHVVATAHFSYMTEEGFGKFDNSINPDYFNKVGAKLLGLYEKMPGYDREFDNLQKQVYRIMDEYPDAVKYVDNYKQYTKVKKAIAKYVDTRKAADLVKAETQIVKLLNMVSETGYPIDGFDEKGRTALRDEYANKEYRPEWLYQKGLALIGADNIEQAKEKLGIKE